MGNQFSDTGALTAQQGAMAQALNQQRAQGIGQGQFGPLNPQMAYQQGAEMVQGGWQNPFAPPGAQQGFQNQFAAQDSGDQIRRLLPPAATQEGMPKRNSDEYLAWRGQQVTHMGALTTEQHAAREQGMYERFLRERGRQAGPPSSVPGGSINQNAPPPPGAVQPGGPTERPRMPTYSVPPGDRPILMAPGSPGDRERPPVTPGTAQPIPPQVAPPSAADADAVFQRRYELTSQAQALSRSGLPPEELAARRAGLANQMRDADEAMRGHPAFQARVNEDRDVMNALIKQGFLGVRQDSFGISGAPQATIDSVRRQLRDGTFSARPSAGSRPSQTPSPPRAAAAGTAPPAERPGDKVVGGFNYSAAQREYDAKRRARVAANNRIPVAKRNTTYGSDANRRAYEAWM